MSTKKGYKSVPWLFGKEIEIPEEWESIIVQDISEHITKGTTPTTEGRKFVKKGIPFIKVENIDSIGNIQINNCHLIDIETHKHLLRSQLVENDILFSIAGTLGRVGLIKKDQTPCNTNQAISIIRLKNEKCNLFYLFVFLRSIFIKKQIQRLETVGAQPNLSLTQVSNFQFFMPPLPEQQKISTILSNVDSLIESTIQVIKNFKSLKKGFVQELLISGICHTRFKEPRFKLRFLKYRIPQEWNISDLKSMSTKIADIDHKMPTKTTDGIKFISANNLNGNEIDFENTEFISKDDYLYHSKKFNAEKNDILISRIGSIGVARIICTDEPFIASYSVALIKPKKDIDSKFLQYYLNSPLPQKVIKAYTIVSGNVNLVLGELGKVTVLLPPFPEQQKIASILSNIDSEITSHEKYKEKLEHLKKSLMQKLLTGEVRV